MIDPFALVILVFAAFRFTTFVVTDTIFDRPRGWLHKHFPVKGTYVEERPKRGKARFVNSSESRWWMDKGTFLGDLTSCFFCFGVWASAALGLAWFFLSWTHLPIILLAIAGGQLILSQWSNRAVSS